MYSGVGQDMPVFAFTVACLTKDAHDKAVAACAAKYSPTHGLGQAITVPELQTGPGDPNDPCTLAKLPICGASSITRPLPGEAPDGGGAPEDEDEEDSKKALMWGGLLVVVLAVGGYAVYRGTKKR